ncbi:hypothetical protein ACIQB5_51535 [Streptomyces sp. NPDC088560]|uniref:hypothetical protein n=1 Tax=Streptomyces sp. NPDC088560 TaxID=3365868 RepID=UPI003829532C
MSRFATVRKSQASARQAVSSPEIVKAHTYFTVVISVDRTTINGEEIPTADTEDVNEAVLDVLHTYAQAWDTAVDGSVTDRRQGVLFLIRVEPDGSSSMLTDSPIPLPTPSGGVDEWIRHINELAAAGRLEHAYRLAGSLRERLAEEVGADHTDAVESRALEAYLAYLCQDHRSAMVLTLGVARIRLRQRDPSAVEDVVRATAVWQRLCDTGAVLCHGKELVALWDHLTANAALPGDQGRLAPYVAGRLRDVERSSTATRLGLKQPAAGAIFA